MDRDLLQWIAFIEPTDLKLGMWCYYWEFCKRFWVGLIINRALGLISGGGGGGGEGDWGSYLIGINKSFKNELIRNKSKLTKSIIKLTEH